MPTPISSATLELPFRAPFDWARLLRFFGGRASLGVEAVEDGAYLRAIEWDGDSGTLTVKRHARKSCLVVSIDGPVARHAAALATPLAQMFDLPATPAAIHAALGADPWLAPLLHAAPGLRIPGTWSAFELVVRTIVGQQVSVKAATTITGRLVQRAGERIAGHPHAATAWRFPTPQALAAADLDAIGMPGKRVAAMQSLARAVALGDLPLDVAGVSLAERRSALLAMPGIGPWTVEYVAMRAWRDADAWPGTDLVLMQTIAARDPRMQSAPQQRARTDNWRPWRAYAAMHLWNEFADRQGVARGG